MVKAESEEQNSLLTRLTVLEQSVNELKKYIGEDAAADTIIITKIALIEEKVTAISKKFPSSEEKKPSNEGKWKLYATIAAGVLTLAGTVITILLESGC